MLNTIFWMSNKQIVCEGDFQTAEEFIGNSREQ